MSQDQSQPYDRALKSLLGDEVAEILPNLLPESEFISEQNIEIDRTTLRADLVYNIQYRGNIEATLISILAFASNRGDEAEVNRVRVWNVLR